MKHEIIIACVVMFVTALVHEYCELSLKVRIGIFLGSLVDTWYAFFGTGWQAGL